MLVIALALVGFVAYMAALGVGFASIARLHQRRAQLGMRRAPVTAYWLEIGGILLALLLGVAGIAAGASVVLAGL